MTTFAEYLDKWLKQSATTGLNNPLVKMPVKRFRLLRPEEFDSLANGGSLLIGTLSDPIARNLYRNFKARIDERGEHCAFTCYGSVEIVLAGAAGQQPRTALLPVCLKRATLQTTGSNIRAIVSDDEAWKFNPALDTRLTQDFGITAAQTLKDDPNAATAFIRAQLGNRATVKSDAYVGLFSSQEMVVRERLAEPPLRQALAGNQVVQARVAGTRVGAVDLGPAVTDDGIEELGLVLPCDDSQLRVVQLSNNGCCLQVEGPPGTGKSQTIANIISNALYHGRTALLVCDKRAAIVQVEKRLADCGLKPALLNLHDEDLDKREFLRQATDNFNHAPLTTKYPFDTLQEARKTLNDRVKHGRATAHPSLQVTRREALAGLIRLRKELKNVPNVDIPSWQALSKERLTKLLNSIREWPGLAAVLTNHSNVWNGVRAEAFDDNPNADNEIAAMVENALRQLESLDQAREWAATIGIESPLESDEDVGAVLTLVNTVINKPPCHPELIGNPALGVRELDRLQSLWTRCQQLAAEHHPVPLDVPYPPEAEREATELLAAVAATSWQDLTDAEAFNTDCCALLRRSQASYQRLCGQLGLIYSPALKTRRAQLQTVLALGQLGQSIPAAWWSPTVSPVLLVAGWVARLNACIDHVRVAPLKPSFAGLDRVGATHWPHVEAMAEHGFNTMSYCLKYVSDRKCKHALTQIYPSIPPRGFKQWREVTLHAVAARAIVGSLRTSAAEAHVALKQLTENYLAGVSDPAKATDGFLANVDVDAKVAALRNAAALVEQWRTHDDLFDVHAGHWHTFWESPSQQVLNAVHAAQVELDSLLLPNDHPDNMETALASFEQAAQRIHAFLRTCETRDGDRSRPVLAAFAAQTESANLAAQLAPLTKYMALQDGTKTQPDWDWLHTILAWRDMFERLRGPQNLDIDSRLWPLLRDRLNAHAEFMTAARASRDRFFEDCIPEDNRYETLKRLLLVIVQALPQRHLWLEKERWRRKMPAFPEITSLWSHVLAGTAPVKHAERLFCFNILRLCDPIVQPHGPQLKATLDSFVAMDDKLTSWTLTHLKERLKAGIHSANSSYPGSAAELKRLSGLQRVRGTVRGLVNANLKFLGAAKPCWMMSPTSLANLVDSQVFEQRGVPFDLVIFDEASQIRVLDGLLSIAFAKQVIIVGDKNQLPPTNFFAGFADPAADPDAAVSAMNQNPSESLLEEFDGAFEDDTSRAMLLSHYRSETPDLIRFSNDWFYSKDPGKPGTGRLEMFPPARIAGAGRRLHYVPDAIYSERAGGRTNEKEACEALDLIRSHVRECPDKSLGVVTMNIPQMELIDELIQNADMPDIQTFCADDSRFFLRNLETVQGDEMDRIILSLTYGKNADGHFNAAVLGPIVKGGGDRRLNVAITRARSGMTIVSSLRASDLDASSATSEGFRCLKALLTDLENAEQNRNFGIGSERFAPNPNGVSNVVYCESPFEEQVVEFLENRGYEIACQYGAGKFRLDIVVKESGRNLLAIECDGASYHSSLVARTRDRARQRNLEKLGWRIHRVWSTNWWFFEQQEKEAIIAAINAARG